MSSIVPDSDPTSPAPAESLRGHVVGLQVSDGGVPKNAVPMAQVRTGGVVGDRQRDLRNHGGPDRAVCVLADETIERLRAEGHPIQRGSTGESLTVAGIGTTFTEGTRLRFAGGVELEVTQPTSPCTHIRASFDDEDPAHLSIKRPPHASRFYARVIVEGAIHEGEAVTRSDPS